MKPILYKLVFLTAMVLSTQSFASVSEACIMPLGKIKATTIVDGIKREYYIHIPSSYNANIAVPLVFMLHGTSGTGEEQYDVSGWSQLAEEEGFIAVFPSSLNYKIIEANGELKTVRRWNTTSDSDWRLQAGEIAYDDVKFLRKIIEEVKSAYSIDAKRIYLNGFSNGGQMAAKCSIEMSDVLAAVCSNAGTFEKDTMYEPTRNMPYLFQVGNKDYGPGNEGPEIPMLYFDSLISTPDLPFRNGKFYNIARNVKKHFDLKEQHTDILGDSTFALLATYLPIDAEAGNEFRYVFVKDLGHSYPNWAPSKHWDWLKQFTLDSKLGAGKKIRVVTEVDAVNREYYIHVPASYDGNSAVPLVFMLHGTSGDGETFYNAHGWKELAEKENFIVVFPSSMKYKIIDEGVNKSIEKWNHTPDANWTFQPGERGQDDIKFLRKVIDEMKAGYNINAKRIYLNGFSNGGSMAAKCAVEMSDVLAAVAGNAASFFIDTVYVPKRKLPVLFQVGNEDYGPGNVGPSVPMIYLDTLLKTENISLLNGKHHRIAQRHIDNFDLQSNYSIEGDTNFALIATYLPNHPGPGTGYEFKFIFVRGLAHAYPNGKNHPFDAPKMHWDWMKQYTLEGSNGEGKKIHVVTEVEEVNREYYIHVPASYDSTKATPMVMFFHGGGHDGELMYNISGWNDVADTANVIMVYPSSLKYCIIEDGVQQVLSQWNNGHSGNTFCPNQVLKDDVLFVNTIMQQMSTKFKIDLKRIYTVGFSNGGEFAATRTAIELSDKIAASISCGGGGALPRDTVLTPKRKLPVMLMFGNKDERMLKSLNITGAVPMGFEILYQKYPVLYFAQVKPYINSFQLDENNYTIIGDTNNVVAAIFQGLSNKAENIFYNVEVKGLEHEYPNGKNHGLHGATYHWKWLNKYTLDGTSVSRQHLSVNNGYGSGDYAAGDTVHIWAAEPSANKTFNAWTGDTETLEVANNWHTTLVMPGHDIALTATYINLPSDLEYKEELIQGKLSKKTVFSYFPPKDKMKGVVWLYQGSNIRGKAWLTNADPRHFVDMLVANGYGIITMDAEEVTQQKDLNNSGAFEYDYSFDTINNSDLVNVKMVRQYFLNKGSFNSSTPMFASGFSSGGGFAEISAGIFRWHASLSHNTAGSDFMAQKSTVPHYQNNSQNDNGPNVGLAGNVSAFEGYNLYLSRNVPTQWILQRPQPLHAERFDRIEGVTLAQSTAIFNAIEKQGLLDANHFLNINPAKVQTDYENNPGKYPALQALSPALVEDLFGQLNVVYTNHAFRSDYNGSALTFLDRFSDNSTAISEVQSDEVKKVIFMPNPATDHIIFGKSTEWSVIELSGRCVKKGMSAEAFVGDLQTGLYIVKTEWGIGRLVKL